MNEKLAEILKDLSLREGQLEIRDLSWVTKLNHFKKAARDIEMLGEIVDSGKISINDIPNEVLEKLTYTGSIKKLTAQDILLVAMQMYDTAGDFIKAAELAIDHDINKPHDIVNGIFERAIKLAFELNDEKTEKRFNEERSRLFSLT